MLVFKNTVLGSKTYISLRWERDYFVLSASLQVEPCGFSSTHLHLIAVGAGFEPAVRLPVRQFSKLLVSATHPSHQTQRTDGKSSNFYEIKNDLEIFIDF